MDNNAPEKFGTIEAWAREIGVSHAALRQRVSAEDIAIFAKDGANRLCPFYTESVIRYACADLLSPLPKSEDDGSFVIHETHEGEAIPVRYKSITGWANHLRISEPSVRSRLKGKIPSIQGRAKNGRTFDFYPEEDVLAACADLCVSLPLADSNGFFVQETAGKTIRYGTPAAWAETLTMAPPTVRKKIVGLVPSIKGKTSIGHVADFYAEHDVLSRCPNIRPMLPKAQEGDCIVLSGESGATAEIRYRTIGGWVKELKLPHNTVKDSVQAKLTVLRGMTANNQIYDFYSEPEVRAACAALLQDLPRATAEGFFVDPHGERCGIVSAWARKFSVTHNAMKALLRSSSSVLGKSSQGQIRDFYRESDVRQACKDIPSHVEEPK